jgi:hypothetical protein
MAGGVEATISPEALTLARETRESLEVQAIEAGIGNAADREAFPNKEKLAQAIITMRGMRGG